MLNILHPRNLVQIPATESRNFLNTLLYGFDIFRRDTNPSRTSQVPARFSRCILHKDSREHNDLGLDWSEDSVVGEVEAV